jgi:hypothetical protein
MLSTLKTLAERKQAAYKAIKSYKQ